MLLQSYLQETFWQKRSDWSIVSHGESWDDFFYIFSSERVRLKFLLIYLVSPIAVRKLYEVARKALYFSVQPSRFAFKVLFPK